MQALYRSGRQAEALDAYQQARATLVEELGIEPGRGLHELETAILEQDPALDLPPKAMRHPEPSRGASSAAGASWPSSSEVSTTRSPARRRLFLLVGEPGIGKSRLADELIAGRDSGARVTRRPLLGGGRRPRVLALGSVARAPTCARRSPRRCGLSWGRGGGARPAPARAARALPRPAGAAVGRVGGRALPPLRGDRAPSSGAPRERARSCSCSTTCTRRTSPRCSCFGSSPASIADSRLLVVCAFRDVDPTMRDPLTSALAELVRERHTTQIALGGSSEADVAEYVELSTAIRPAPRLRRGDPRRDRGESALRRGGRAPPGRRGPHRRPDADLRIPPGVRAVIDQRVGRLSERCRSLLVPASVMGREFGLDALTRLSELPRDQLLDALDEAVAERIVGDVPGSPGAVSLRSRADQGHPVRRADPGAPHAAPPGRRRGARGGPLRRSRRLTSPSSRTTTSRRLRPGWRTRPSSTRAAPRTGRLPARVRGGRAPL